MSNGNYSGFSRCEKCSGHGFLVSGTEFPYKFGPCSDCGGIGQKYLELRAAPVPVEAATPKAPLSQRPLGLSVSSEVPDVCKTTITTIADAVEAGLVPASPPLICDHDF
jgi:hypothetical protein